MYVCVCVSVHLIGVTEVSTCVFMYVWTRMCVCVCVSVYLIGVTEVVINVCIYVCVYTRMYICVCVSAYLCDANFAEAAFGKMRV